MKPADRKAFAEIVVAFAELKGRQLSAPALELYWRAMQRWSIEQFRAVAEQLVRSCKFFPTPAEFEDARKAGRLTATEAWPQVLTILRTGSYRDGVTHADPRVNAAVQALGGYHALAMTNSDQLPFREKRFAEHLETITDVEDTRAGLPDLTGGPRLETEIPGRAFLALVKRP